MMSDTPDSNFSALALLEYPNRFPLKVFGNHSEEFEAIVLDWKGLEEDGKAVPYNQANCIRILTDYKDFREQISEIANEMESFKIAEDEDAEKN